MLSVQVLLLLSAFVVTIAAGMNKAPLWPAVLLVVVAELLRLLPAA